MTPVGSTAEGDSWSTLEQQVESLRRKIQAHKAVTVGRQATRDDAKATVQTYFRETRKDLLALGFSDSELSTLDARMQELLQLSNGVSQKTAYSAALRDTRQLLGQIEMSRELRIGVTAHSSSATTSTEAPSNVERAILDTLEKLEPGAARGYEQAMRDLNDPDRVSFRGVAAELREVVREVLDRLAPDEDLEAAGIKREKGRTDFTQKQKVRHILRARGVTENARKPAEQSVELIEEMTASLARSVYVRGSVSTHVSSPRTEVRQLKLYVDSILGELLAIHGQP
jgi:Predicted pPIWI-associating nuclease